MVKNENYINIQGWMLNELNLKGNQLLIYALIYTYTQGIYNGYFTGSLQDMSDWTNSTKQGCLKALKELKKKGFIIPLKQGRRVLYKTKRF